MLKLAILFSILFSPFNFISYTTETSSYHISCFILIFISIFSLLRKGKFTSKTVLLLILFFAIQFFLVYFFQIAPLSRFLSGLVWFGGLLLVYSQARFLNCDPKSTFKFLVLSGSMSILIGLIQYHSFNIDRPKGFFDEPSIAGLFFFSMASATVFILTKFKFKLQYTLLLVGFLLSLSYVGILTKSLHIITFLISLAIFYLLLNYDKLASIFSAKFLLKLFSFAILLVPIIFLSMNFIDMDHITTRLAFSGEVDSGSASTLSWLRGLDQALASISMSPLFGLGLGSTGHFNFYSAHSNILQMQGLGYLNLNDAYSLGFRLIIEIGILFVCLFAYILFRRLMSFKEYLFLSKEYTDFETIATQFIFVFSTSIIIGCLIKEPLYPQPLLYIAVVTLSSVKLKNINKPVYIQVKQEHFL